MGVPNPRGLLPGGGLFGGEKLVFGAGPGRSLRNLAEVAVAPATLPSFLQLGRDISTTQRIRDLGADLHPIARRWASFKHLAFSMLLMGLRRGQTQAMALDIRGYGAHKTRTFLRPIPSSTTGRVFGWTCFGLAVAYLVLQIGNLGGHMPWDFGD